MSLVSLLIGAAAFGVEPEEPDSNGVEGKRPLGTIIDPLIEAQSGRAVGPPYHGVAIQVDSSHDAVQRFGRLIREIAELGADTVLISVNGFQEHVDSVPIEVDPLMTPSDDDLCALFEAAHGAGLRVILMPKILLSDPRGGAWRGQIKPPTWDGWFNQYRRFLLRYARLAQRCNVEVFIVGSELVSTEKLTDCWLDTIRQVREVYGGKLAYSANWDHFAGIQFWDALDLMGMTTYFKLADEPRPTVSQLRSAWRDIKQRILAAQHEVDRPILFTEAGWCSQEGCSVEAWNYYRQEHSSPAGLEEQRSNYEAFIDTWEDVGLVGGIIWWEWTEGEAGENDFGYSPKNKPAERLLRDLFSRKARRPSP